VTGRIRCGGQAHRLSLLLASALSIALVLVSVAEAHSGGKALPRISAVVTGKGLTRDVSVQLTDADDGDPIEEATVTVGSSMERPHPMSLAPEPLFPTGSGKYEGRVQLVMPAVWTLKIAVTGKDVVPATATVRTKATLFSSGATTTRSSPSVPPTRIEATLVRSDYQTMAVLWVHGLASMGWILGVIAMTIALATDPTVLEAGIRTRLSRWYRRFGAWLHWALVPVIVVTGIYNTQRVTPFTLAWTPGGFRRLSDIPYGRLYEAILLVKLGLFVVLLVTGTLLLRRTLRAYQQPTGSAPASAFRLLWSGLGSAGVVYLATVPLILAAAMALRYVHILSHVAVVLGSSR
jgi:uncharacterized membrane protein